MRGNPPRAPWPNPMNAVYPRACGGTDGKLRSAQGKVGLSPRVRGNRSRLPCPGTQRRSIPARAGEPLFTRRGLYPRRVYPRACGGTSTAATAYSACIGLSPRVRGNRGKHWRRSPQTRSIPARAGEPTSRWSKTIRGWVYPRACGGTSQPEQYALYAPGLSPRVRGNRTTLDTPTLPLRSIPARAGEPPAGTPSGT